MRSCLGRIDLSRGFLRLAFSPRRTNGANETALSFQPNCEWSDWGERHGWLRREVAVERSGSCRDTIGQFARQPCLDAPKLPRLSKSFSLSRFLIFNFSFLLARSARLILPSSFILFPTSFFLLLKSYFFLPTFFHFCYFPRFNGGSQIRDRR